MSTSLIPSRPFTGKGTYILLIALATTSEIDVGRLGAIVFKRGNYAYAGSALGGFNGRIGRHLRKNKKLRWHIDHLLKFADIVDVLTIENDGRLECDVAKELKKYFEPINGFGCSDCKCTSHLYFSKNGRELKKRATEIIGMLAGQKDYTSNSSTTDVSI